MQKSIFRSGVYAAAFLALGLGCKKKDEGGGGSNLAPPTITSTPNVSAAPGEAYEYDDDGRIDATGEEISFSLVEGPDGFEVNANNGAVSWTPDEEGSFEVILQVSNEGGAASQSFIVFVTEGGGGGGTPVLMDAPEITSTPSLQATVDEAYDYDGNGRAEADSEGDVSWSVVSAPNGFSINANNGTVSWTPDTVGTFEIIIGATNAGGLSTQHFNVQVLPQGDGDAPIIISSPDTAGLTGLAYAYDDDDGLPTTTGDTPITYSLETAPAGMTVDEDTGEITFTPAAAGSYDVVLQASNWVGDYAQAFTLVVTDPSGPVFTSTPTTSATEGVAYAYDGDSIAEADALETITWSVTEGPAGFSIDSVTGEVSWTPVGDGDIDITITATDVYGSTDQSFTVSVTAAPVAPIITSTASTNAINGQAYVYNDGNENAFATADGDAPLTWSATTAPAGFTIDANTGEVSWTPSATGDFDVTLQADNLVGSDTQSFTITVIDVPPEVDEFQPAGIRSEYDKAITIRGQGFDRFTSITATLSDGANDIVLTSPTIVDANTITATFSGAPGHPSGVFDLLIEDTVLADVTFEKCVILASGTGTTHSAVITTETWTPAGNPHFVTGWLDVVGTLTIEAGTLVMFTPGNTGLEVGYNAGVGALVTDVGTPRMDDPVVFTSNISTGDPDRGDWRGIRFGSLLDEATTSVNNVIVEYGGTTNNIGLFDLIDGAAPAINYATLRESADKGMTVWDSGGGMNGIDNLFIAHNDEEPLLIYANYVGTMGDNIVMEDNAVDEIYVYSDYLTRPDARFKSWGTPYRTTGTLYVNGTDFVIEPGVEIRFNTGSELLVGNWGSDSAVIADGSTGPITLTSTDGTPGTWAGVQLEQDTTADTVFRSVTIENFGSSNNGGLDIDDLAGPLVIENSTFQDGTTPGLYLDQNAEITTFSGNYMTGNTFSLFAYASDLDDVLSADNVYDDPIDAYPGTVGGGEHVWGATNDALGDPVEIQFRNDNLTVRGAKVTIEAGVQMTFYNNRYFYVDATGGYDSELDVEGTSSDPVLFTARTPASQWYGLRLYGAPEDGDRSSIDYAIVEYAGGTGSNRSNDRGAIEMRTSARYHISNTVVRDSNGNGVYFDGTSHAEGMFTGNEIHDNEYAAVYIYGDFVGRLGSGNNYHDNLTAGTGSYDGIRVINDILYTDATWPDDGSPYYVTGGNWDSAAALYVRGSSTLTLDPGVEMYFTDDSRVYVGEDSLAGDLVAVGTDVDPIILSAIGGSPGDWYGLYFYNEAQNSELEYVTLQYGGGPTGSLNDDRGAIELRPNAEVRIEDCDIIDGNTNGVYFQNGSGADAGFNNNTITGHRYHAIDIYGNYVGSLASATGNVLAPNDSQVGEIQEDGIRVRSDIIDTTATWVDHGVPYVITDGDLDGDGLLQIRDSTLTIDQGVTIAFAGRTGAEDGEIRVGDGGSGAANLIVDGAVGNEVVFTSATADEVTPFLWDEIIFYNLADASSITNAVLDLGGDVAADYGMIRFRNGTVVDLDSVLFQDSADVAARWETGAVPTFNNISYSGNAFDCIYQQSTGMCITP